MILPQSLSPPYVASSSFPLSQFRSPPGPQPKAAHVSLSPESPCPNPSDSLPTINSSYFCEGEAVGASSVFLQTFRFGVFLQTSDCWYLYLCSSGCFFFLEPQVERAKELVSPENNPPATMEGKQMDKWPSSLSLNWDKLEVWVPHHLPEVPVGLSASCPQWEHAWCHPLFLLSIPHLTSLLPCQCFLQPSSK